MERMDSSTGSLSCGGQGRSVNNNIRYRTNLQQTLKDTATSSIASYPVLLNVSIVLQSLASIISFIVIFFRCTEPQILLPANFIRRPWGSLCPLSHLTQPNLTPLSMPLNVCSSPIAIPVYSYAHVKANTRKLSIIDGHGVFESENYRRQ
jgi:hypothetical protein